MSEDKGQASGLEVELAVPVVGTEQQPPPPPPQHEQQGEAEEEGGDPVSQAETDEERSARAERRRRSRERKRQQEEQMVETIARQGEMLEQLFGVVQGLSTHTQGGVLQQAQATHAAAKAEMAKAYESGDPHKVAEATEALTIARLNLDAITHRRQQRPQPIRTQPEGREQQPNPYQQAWLSKNEWYRDPDRLEDAEIAFGISRALVADGYPENDPEHFAELDRRLKKRGIAVTQGGGHTPPKVVVASGQRQSLTPGKNKVVLNTRVQEHAAKFGVNLNDPATRERIAKRIQAQQTR
jgi:hypothetical protein